MVEPIEVVSYDPGWIDDFRVIFELINQSLGSLLPVTIEHVGSTAVPGLAAKPIIDLDLVIESRDQLSVTIEQLIAIGYEHQGDLGVQGREAFKVSRADTPAGRLPRHNLYVCARGNPELKRHLAFRDHLRNCPDDARNYAKLKYELAEKHRLDRNAYSSAKTDFINSIYAKLRDAAQPGI